MDKFKKCYNRLLYIEPILEAVDITIWLKEYECLKNLDVLQRS